MRTFENLNWETIDKSTPEGQALLTAVCVLAAVLFPKSKPDMVLQVIKDIRMYPFVSESFEEKMKRIVEEHQKKYN